MKPLSEFLDLPLVYNMSSVQHLNESHIYIYLIYMRTFFCLWKLRWYRKDFNFNPTPANMMLETSNIFIISVRTATLFFSIWTFSRMKLKLSKYDITNRTHFEIRNRNSHDTKIFGFGILLRKRILLSTFEAQAHV